MTRTTLAMWRSVWHTLRVSYMHTGTVVQLLHPLMSNVLHDVIQNNATL